MLEEIRKDVQGLLQIRFVFQRVRDIILTHRARHPDARFYNWMGKVYPPTIVMGIRRQLEINPRHDLGSMGRLLSSIKEAPAILTRARLISIFASRDVPGGVAEKYWAEEVGDQHPVLTTEILEQHLAGMRDHEAKIKGYADKRIAHFDRGQFDGAVTYGDLDAALDALRNMLFKYLLIIRGEAHRNLDLESRDLEALFRHAWIPPA